MIFLLDIKKGRNAVLIIIIVSISGLLLYKIRTDIMQWYSAGLSYCAYPILKTYHYLIDPFIRMVDHHVHVQELTHKIAIIQNKCDTLQQHLVQLKADNWYAKDTDILRLSAQQYNADYNRIVQIMVRHFSESAHYFLVDAGSLHGITNDMIAVYNDCLIGRVIEVYPWYSKVMLLTDRNCKIAVLIGNERISGIHEGNNASTTCVQYISHLKTITKGDLVLSSGQGLIFPYGFGLGIVHDIQHNGALQQIIVEPFLDFKELRYCTLMNRVAQNTIKK